LQARSAGRRSAKSGVNRAAGARLLNAGFSFRASSRAPIQLRFIALLKPPFKSPDDYRRIAGNQETGERAKSGRGHRR
jgi:hypothetical protein